MNKVILSNVVLESVYLLEPDIRNLVLWRLLGEREEITNISHKTMPTWTEHCTFVDSNPYTFWYFIQEIQDKWGHKPIIGTIYLTHKNEIGIQVFKGLQKQGYALAAINELVKQHPRKRYLANINPRNEASIKLFEKFGFRHCQNTYERIS